MLKQLMFVFDVLRLAPPLLLIRTAILLARPGLRRRTTPLHELGIVGFWLYLSAVCYLTVNVVRILHGHFGMGQNYNLTPFAEITAIATCGDTTYALLNIAGNVIMFAPLGFLLPLLWRGWGMGRVFCLSLFLSAGIEVLQLFTGRGADIDDVILNTLGGLIGFFVHNMIRALCPGTAACFRLRVWVGQPRQRERDQFLENRPNTRTRPNEVAAEARRLPQVDGLPTSHGRAFRKTALVTTAASLLVLVSGSALLGGFSGYSARNSPGAAPAYQPQGDVELAVQAVWDIPPVNSTNILLASADMSQVLYEEKADQHIYPASLTKMMTAVLALECIEDLEESVRLRDTIFIPIYEDNLSTAGFQPGEEVRAMDLLYGVMLPSGAECAAALAEHIAGSEEAFALLMNGKARDLGMNGTHFLNATGAHHKEHYTTAGDMALLFSYALNHPIFRETATLDRYHTASTSLHPEGIAFSSTLFGRMEGTAFPGGVLLGGKTGYTDEAGQCLASFAQIDGREYILVTAGAMPKDFREEQLHIEDALAIYGALAK